MTASTVYDGQLDSFSFSGYDTLPVGAQYELKNNGHAGKETTSLLAMIVFRLSNHLHGRQFTMLFSTLTPQHMSGHIWR